MKAIVKPEVGALPSLEKAFAMLAVVEQDMRSTQTFEAAIRAKAVGKMALAAAATATKERGKELEVRAADVILQADTLHAQLDERPGSGRKKKTNTSVSFSQAEHMAKQRRKPLLDLSDDERDAYREACKRNKKPASKSEAVHLAKMPEQERTVVLAKLASGDAKTVKDAQKKRRREEQAAIPADLPKSTDRYKLHTCDLLDAPIDDESIDVIITDPPYPEEFLPVYSSLSQLAARVLKPGGSCIVMIGQSYLPDVVRRLSENLNYQWTIAYLTPGGQSSPSLKRLHVNTFWKPLLWFVKGKHVGEHVGDVIKSDINDNDKRFHDWGQSESGMRRIVEAFSKPGMTVLDPFCGGGTTGRVALELNRMFVGIDSDEQQIRITSERLGKVAA